tara:strand:- start:959 stop:1201 length:243 start_codon:yes stop_codon:yes gene_type:complete
MNLHNIKPLMPMKSNEKQCDIHVVGCCFDISKRKPKLKQEILYEGNHGFSVGVYDYFENGIGWVLLPEGGKDCFDRWKQK